MKQSAQQAELLQLLDIDDLEQRVDATPALHLRFVQVQVSRSWGETENEHTLKMPRERLASMGKEHYALIVAVGKLKKRLKVK